MTGEYKAVMEYSRIWMGLSWPMLDILPQFFSMDRLKPRNSL